MKKICILITALLFITVFSCKESFYETPPLGQASNTQLLSKDGIDKLLIGAYSLLDGIGASTDGSRGPEWASAVSNWVYGDVPSDDAYKGSSPNDQPDINAFERFDPLPVNGFLDQKWRTLYDGVSRCNDVLKAIQATKNLEEADVTRLSGEARFLRGFYYFELRKLFKNVPYVDETTTDSRVSNDQEIWPKVEADFQFASQNLPPTQAQVGRANAWAAKAFLAKTYLFQNKYTEAKPLLDDLIVNGVTSNGLKYGLESCFRDAFDVEKKNGKESVFAVQMSVNDGSPESDNGNFGDILNYGFIGDAGSCCGFFQPSQNLVNAYKTDPSGLPLFEEFNNSDLKNDQGIESSDNSYIPDRTTPLDPRLDWTVGRRGIPYLDYGINPGKAWINTQSYGGPYLQVKGMFKKSQKGKFSTTVGWAQAANANNYTVIRFSDVLLWAAECEVEVGDINKARDYVNQIRSRAKEGCKVTLENGTPAANYQIQEYSTFPSQEYARRAIRFERRLELALEGHRFYDLVRWGVADQVLNAYLAQESKKRTYLGGAIFIKGKNEYLPVPQVQITNSYKNGLPTLVQNPGYN